MRSRLCIKWVFAQNSLVYQMMVKVLPKSKQTCVCTFVPSAGKCLPLKIQKTSLLYQLIPINIDSVSPLLKTKKQRGGFQ